MSYTPATDYLCDQYNKFTKGAGTPVGIVGHVGRDLYEMYWSECTKNAPIYLESAKYFKSARLKVEGDGWHVRFERKPYARSCDRCGHISHDHADDYECSICLIDHNACCHDKSTGYCVDCAKLASEQ